VPRPISNAADSVAEALKQTYDAYAICAGRYAELIKNQQYKAEP